QATTRAKSPNRAPTFDLAGPGAPVLRGHLLVTNIFVMARDGQQQQPLTNQGNSVGPVPSPDGSKVLFAHHDPTTGQSHIFVMNADGSGTVDLTRTDSAYDSNPSWSPDGRRIVFVQYSGPSLDHSEIVVINAD